MAGEFAKSLNYIKTGVSFDKDMCIEFVDSVSPGISELEAGRFHAVVQDGTRG